MMPLFVKAGTILPLGPIQQHTGEQAAEHGGPDEVTLRVYPLTLPNPARAEGVLREDGGTTTYVYDEGTLTIEPEAGAPQARTYTVEVVGRDPKTATQRTEGAAQIEVTVRPHARGPHSTSPSSVATGRGATVSACIPSPVGTLRGGRG